MIAEYSVQTCRRLERMFRQADVCRPMRIARYDPGTELTYEVTGVAPANKATVRLAVEKFVGGGFAGQVYRVRIIDIAADDGPVAGLVPGAVYAMKIFLPPSNFARVFRDAVYAAGFGGAFSLRANPSAARAGAIWQKLIRRGATITFGTDRAVVDVLATFVDAALGSCGEISEWIEGRNWRFEVDDRLHDRWRWAPGADDSGLPTWPAPAGQAGLGSPEYRAKRAFMAGMVKLLHDMGAAELARQYEWWTCKSQPNVLKRTDRPDATGLTAVDFRAGLALLPILPMSPADFKLIGKGAARGSLVQFDRGDPGKLQRYIDAHAEDFADLRDAIEELKSLESEYRESLPDAAHHHVRLLYSRRLWRSILDSSATGWRVRNITDLAADDGLRKSRFRTVVFYVLGLVPLLGGLIRKLWGRADYRSHYARLLNSGEYLRRAVRAHLAESLIVWHRAGRVSAGQAEAMPHRPTREVPWRLAAHAALSVLPAKLHRFLTDRSFAADALKYIFVRPIRLYFNADAREKWLRDMLEQGRRNHMLSDEDAQQIRSRIKDPFIQKYLKSLAVHLCTLPITQIVSVIVAWIDAAMHPGLSAETRAFRFGMILILFQITPISPGSLARGLYVVYLVIRERNFKDYNIAVFLGFFKYVGYLAFPIQMAYRYPALARFMAAHWATGAAHIVPVFGERGALLEHGVFDIFYNYPLSVRRRLGLWGELRRTMKVRTAPAVICGAAAAAALFVTDAICARFYGAAPTLWNIWPLVILVPAAAGFLASRLAGGARTAKRIIIGAICTGAAGALYGLFNWAAACFVVPPGGQIPPAAQCLKLLAGIVIWRVFLFALIGTAAAAIAEMTVPEPKLTAAPQSLQS